jgi:hypothetical protein
VNAGTVFSESIAHAKWHDVNIKDWLPCSIEPCTLPSWLKSAHRVAQVLSCGSGSSCHRIRWLEIVVLEKCGVPKRSFDCVFAQCMSTVPPQAGDPSDSTAQAQSLREENYKQDGRGGTLDCDPFELPRPSKFIHQSVLSQNQHLGVERLRVGTSGDLIT